MRLTKKRVFLSLLLIGICGCFLSVLGAIQGMEQTQETQTEENTIQEAIVPAPKDIKETIAIYVFLGWMWLSIFVLIYILRQKIKEVDRIHNLKFFSSSKKGPQ